MTHNQNPLFKLFLYLFLGTLLINTQTIYAQKKIEVVATKGKFLGGINAGFKHGIRKGEKFYLCRNTTNGAETIGIVEVKSVNERKAVVELIKRKNNIFIEKGDYLGSLIQENRIANKVIFGEFGGNGITRTLNSERLFLNNHFGIRFGTGYPFSISFPLLVNFYAGEHDGKLELGIGLVYMVWKGGEDNKKVFHKTGLTSTIGYRYQPQKGGFVVRIGFTPHYDIDRKILFPGFGISLGTAH
jgi:hypothetical protein